jgi:protein-S-isoprenylcysteine O-methyltransferase Ste14
MTPWGIGPRLMLTCLVPALFSLALSKWLSPLFEYPFPDAAMKIPLAVALVSGGVLFWVCSVVTIMKAYSEKRLCTSGVYGLCRHPVYASWVLFILPGLSLLFDSWLFLASPLVMYSALCTHAPVEDRYLEDLFGEEYTRYRERVPAVLPTGWLRKEKKSNKTS